MVQNGLRCGVFAGVIVASCVASLAGGEIVYSQDFEGVVANGVDGRWSSALVNSAPSGSRQFLGQFGNDEVRLTLDGLEPGRYLLAFDFLGIGTWDGNQYPGPDWFVVSAGQSGEVMRSTFAIGSEDTRIGWQSYPDASAGPAVQPGRTMAIENNSLGFLYAGIYERDAVWRLSVEFDVTESTTQIAFKGEGLQSLADESWGIDQVQLSIIPSPGAAGLLMAGGLVSLRRRRAQ